jgi:hypothetical protein
LDYTAQRRFPRIDSENAVLVRSMGAYRREGFAKTRVVGLGGCMIVSDEPLGVGAYLDLALVIRGALAHSKGRVVYEIPRGGEEVEVGVQFLGISPENREVIDGLFRRQRTS